MDNALKVMILEDQKTDQELIKRQALKYQPNSIFSFAQDKASFLEKIDWFLPDLLFADYKLPDYTGLNALMYIKENKPFIPFVFVTGELPPSDPIAEVVLKLADGFVLKDDISTLHLELDVIITNVKVRIANQSRLTKLYNDKRLKILKEAARLKDSDDLEDISKKEYLMTLLQELEQEG